MTKPDKAEWTEFFDDHAPAYEQNVFTRNTLAEVDFLVEELALVPGHAVLDIGCGTGRHAIELARRDCRLTGLDLSAGMLEQARHRAAASGVEVRWLRADARNFTLPQQFDAAICLCEGAFGLLGGADDPLGQPQAILRNLAAALKSHAKCVFTVLNGYALARRHSQADVEQGSFDPLSLAERSDCRPPGTDTENPLRERAFVPTELVLLFAAAGLEVLNIWGGTAGNWGRRPIQLDEIEIMVVARKSAAPPRAPYRLFSRR